MRYDIRQGELEDQKKCLVDTFYNEVNCAFGFLLEGRIDYEQFEIDDDGKTLYWTSGDNPMTATRGKFDFLALSSLATKYGVGGGGHWASLASKTSRLSIAAERAF